METLKKLISQIDALDKIVKIILCIPALDLVWSIYRLLRSIVANNVVGIVISVVLICCAPFMWLVDLICVLLNGKIWTID